ncbi:ComEC/Rec2 family competence protein [Salana multivorans]
MRTDLRLAGPALVAWAAGVAAPSASLLGRALLLGVGLAVAGLGVRWGTRRGRGAHRARWSHPAPVLVLAGLAACAVVVSVLAQDAVRRPRVWLEAIEAGRSRVELRIDSGPRSASPGPGGGARVSFAATVLEVAALGGQEVTIRSPVRVIAPGEWRDVVPGQRASTIAALRPTPTGERATALVIASGPPETDGARPPPLLELAAGVRADLRAAAAPLPGHAQLLPGIAVGDDDAVPAALADAMRATSLGHLLAVSGAHVAIVLGLALALAGSARTALRIVVGAAVLAGLVLLVGPEPSVVRATGMGVVLLVAQALGRRGQAVAALGSAVVVLVVVDPWIAGSLGFALSVSATAGIVLASRPLGVAIAPRLGRAAVLAPAIAVPLAAQLACLPVLLLADPGLALYGVPANALVAPVVPGITLLGLGAATLGGVWPEAASALLWAATPGTWWIDQVATRLAGAPLARLPWPAGWRGLVLAAGIAASAWWARDWWRRHGAALVAIALCCLLAAALSPPTRDAVGAAARSAWPEVSIPERWDVLACDIGQGTAVLVVAQASGPVDVESSGRSVLLLDAGPPDGGIAACLRAAGVDRVNALVLSHADLDHVGGLADVVATVPVERAFLPAVPDERLDDVRAELAAAGVPVTELLVPDDAAAAPIVLPGTVVEVLWPTERAVTIRGDLDAEDANGLSLTVLVRTSRVTVLAPGDLGAGAQAALLRSRASAAVLGDQAGIDVVIAPHHGSPDSDPAFLATTAGRVALVTVGAENTYGHPAPWVIEELRAAGSHVLRTDTCGTVAVRRVPGTGGLEVTRCPEDLGERPP